ncbi:coniferyl alcohol acyltransferase-like [Cryptomeria japonica]|uniref:coniferyl alcohol acyltransferase-like n=1 Tax=Cryptomeria japonica TaxID=3369 RepID=UPI0027DAA3DF|nr:coniferyl alcohol acyltransferase-like [Cryptomeria japonica]
MEKETLKDFRVEIVRTFVMQSPVPTKDCTLKGSNIDLTVPAISPGHFFVYKAVQDKTYREIASSIKKALCEVLVLFYPVAGRFIIGHNGEPEIECNNQGVPFVEAEADAAIKDLDFSQPSFTAAKLTPTRHPLQGESPYCIPVLAVQVTKMNCGGIVVGCCFDHRIVDGISSYNFFKAWTEAAQGLSSSIITPCFDRSLITPHHPLNTRAVPVIDGHYMALPFSALDRTDPPPPQIGRIYHLDAPALLQLQALANQTQGKTPLGKSITKMEAVSSYIWKVFARAQALTSSEPTRIGIPIDGRAYLNLPPVALCAAGATELESVTENGVNNGFIQEISAIPFKESYAEHILKQPLSKIAEIVRNVISASANSEYFRSVVDWVEEKRPAAMLVRVYGEEGSAVVVSSGMRIPLYEFDFGCGKPTFSSVYFPWGGTAGYVMLQASPLGEGNMVVYMHMAEKDLDAIETDPEFLFVRVNRMNCW